MSDVEDRLRAALRAEADRRPVDLTALHERVEARLSERARPRRGWAPRTVLPLVAAAAAAAAVAGTVVVVDRLRTDDSIGPAQVQGGVDDSFTCPSRGRTVFDEDNTDDSFLPELTEDLRPVGEAAALPRYEVQRLGDRVRVRFADEDGTLASVVVFQRTGDGYEPVTVTKCTNGPGPRSPVVSPGTAPRGSAAVGQFTADDFTEGAVKLFDTVTYDVNGLPILQSTWAEPCGRALCVSSGKKTSYVYGRIRPDDAAPTDATALLYDPDTIVGQRTGYRFVLYYDRDSSLVTVSWRAKDGHETADDPVVGGWPGFLWTMVVPRNDFTGVKLYRVHGTEFFPADEITE